MSGEAFMAAVRDQAARVLRAEPDNADSERDAANDSAALAEQLRSHVADEANLDLSRYPAIRAWLARVKAQPRHVEMPGVDA